MINPFTGKEYSPEAIKERIIVSGFPAADPIVLKQFDKLYKNNDVIIVKAETGAGKGVVIAPHVMELENVVKKQATAVNRIYITEPRTTNTLVANYVRKVMDANVIDYAYRFDNNIKPETRLAFVTDGFLLNFFYRGELECTAIIIDEVHERNKNIDQLMAFCIKQNKKLVLLSATIDVQEYANYFKKQGVKKIATQTIEGRTNEVTDIFLNLEENYVKQSVELVRTICQDQPPGDVLIFLASSGELQKACKMLQQMNLNITCYELHRGTPEETKEIIVSENKNTNQRKIVFSTNVAESGITVQGIKYVIDTGRRYEAAFNSKEQMYELTNRFISRAEAEQRRGRAGRTESGTCYHLYSKNDYETKFAAYKDPEIITEEISGTILSILSSNYAGGNMKKVNELLSSLMTPPIEAQITFGTKLLEELKVIKSNELTDLGREVGKIALDPQQAIVMIAGKSFGLERETCMILAMISIDAQLENYFVATEDKKNFMKKTAKFVNSQGEPFAMQSLFKQYLQAQDRRKWCHDHYLQWSKMQKAEKQFYKLSNLIKEIKPLFNDQGTTLKDAIEMGYGMNVATKEDYMYRIDRPIGFIKLEQPRFLSRMGKKILFMDIRKIGEKYVCGGIINL